jgi:AcrR family transcriptional regulator
VPKAIDEPRNGRSRRTRAQLLAATRDLLEEGGFESLTMAAVAERAGVSRRALYLHFASRTELVTALFDYVGEQEGLLDSLRRVWDAPDAGAALAEWAAHVARYHPRVLAVDRAVDRVRRADPDAARHWETVARNQQAAVRRLAGRLHDEGRLAPQWTVESAADMLWALLAPGVVERLTVERGWSPGRFADQLALLLRSTFLREPAGAAGQPPAG